MSKVFGYMRVSQATQTTDNQKLELLASNLSITEWYSDDGVSGTTPQMERKGFRAMIEAAEAGSTIVMAKLDRLGRNAMDVLNTLDQLKTKKLKIIVLQLGQLDVTSPAGKLMMTMLAAVAEMEMDLLKERIHSGLDRAKKDGVIMGAPAKIDPVTLQHICEDKAKGLTLDEIAAKYDVSRATAGRAIKRWKDNLEGYTYEFHSKARYLEKKRARV
jgi:putative DNA-invertase from lambdoid prophage Rac